MSVPILDVSITANKRRDRCRGMEQYAVVTAGKKVTTKEAAQN